MVTTAISRGGGCRLLEGEPCSWGQQSAGGTRACPPAHLQQRSKDPAPRAWPRLHSQALCLESPTNSKPPQEVSDTLLRRASGLDFCPDSLLWRQPGGHLMVHQTSQAPALKRNPQMSPRPKGGPGQQSTAVGWEEPPDQNPARLAESTATALDAPPVRGQGCTPPATGTVGGPRGGARVRRQSSRISGLRGGPQESPQPKSWGRQAPLSHPWAATNTDGRRASWPSAYL